MGQPRLKVLKNLSSCFYAYEPAHVKLFVVSILYVTALNYDVCKPPKKATSVMAAFNNLDSKVLFFE